MANEKNESKEMQELRAQLDAQQKKLEASAAEAADLKVQLDAQRARGGGEKTTASILAGIEGKWETPKDLPEKYRGKKRYRVGLQGGYYRGRLLSAGDLVTLTDDVPSRTWALVADDVVDPVVSSAPTKSNTPVL